MRPYYALNDFFQAYFAAKVAKVSLDVGFTCPNRDGSKGIGGCAFCSAQGSGEFAGRRELSIAEQFDQITRVMARKWPHAKYIVHFQAFTNTYGPVEYLRACYQEALSLPGVIGLAIATRPDCLSSEILDLLDEIGQKHFLWVELGLQTSHASTAHALNMGYTLVDFTAALEELNSRRIRTVGHIIYGLPGESEAMMQETARRVARLPLWGLKMHLFHLLKGSSLEQQHALSPLTFLSREEYLRLVIYTLEHLSPDVVIHRLTGDPPRRLLIGPDWCTDKWGTLNELHRLMRDKGVYQGCQYMADNQGMYIPPSH